jgi:dCTP diphosphatase
MDVNMGEIKEITEKIKKFRDERDWKQFHNHKDMALSLILEATEVLEHFQWKTPKEVNKHGAVCKNEIADELADVAMYLFELADNLGINLSDAIEKNDQKYQKIPC